MKIKSQFPKLKSPAILAPMSGVSDVAFRVLCKKYGAGLTYTEFISSNAVLKNNKNIANILKVDKSERPIGVQLFGDSIDNIFRAGKIVKNKFDIIDINFGCPASKIVSIGAGSEMLKKPNEIGAIIKKLADNINKPITLKIRIGIDNKHINAVEVAKIAEKAGAAAITVHGRTQKQGYSGKADWEIIKRVKEAVKIPVIGNGDVFSPENFKSKLHESGVDAIMIGRGAIGNPYIFKQINDYLRTGKYDQPDKIKDFFEYLKLAKKYKIEFNQIKSQAIYFTKGLSGSARIREQISHSKTVNEIERLMKKFK
jgi:nifR3 family TIM-barrel protein